MIEVLFAAAGLVEEAGEGAAEAEGAGAGASCDNFTLIVGAE